MGFVTVLLTYERTEKSCRGPSGVAFDEKRFGWVIRINGFNYIPEFRKAFPKFTWRKDQLELTCFEEKALSCDQHDQYHPPLTLVTKFLDQIDELGYQNTSCSLTAEKKEITFCLWNFQIVLLLACEVNPTDHAIVELLMEKIEDGIMLSRGSPFPWTAICYNGQPVPPVTSRLTYESTEKTVKGLDDEQFGWVIRINGLPEHCYSGMSSAKFIVMKGQLVLTCFEEPILSYEVHDQFHPPMGLVTKFLGMIVQQGYLNTSSSITAERNEMTFCLWNFQKR